jgi:hypothetical protein
MHTVTPHHQQAGEDEVDVIVAKTVESDRVAVVFAEDVSEQFLDRRNVRRLPSWS